MPGHGGPGEDRAQHKHGGVVEAGNSQITQIGQIGQYLIINYLPVTCSNVKTSPRHGLSVVKIQPWCVVILVNSL